ncbi:MAG: MarR family transcriptional regulator [Candidatus Bathyarchaeota archaeon]
MKIQREGGFLITKIHQISGRTFSKILKKAGIDEINPAQGRILFVLWKKDEIPISELAKRTLLSKSTLTSMIDRLGEAGYVVRVRSKKDRRTILIKRTEKDKLLEKKYIQVSNEMIDLFYRGFTTEEIDTLEDYLKRILTNLTKNANINSS